METLGLDGIDVAVVEYAVEQEPPRGIKKKIESNRNIQGLVKTLCLADGCFVRRQRVLLGVRGRRTAASRAALEGRKSKNKILQLKFSNVTAILQPQFAELGF